MNANTDIFVHELEEGNILSVQQCAYANFFIHEITTGFRFVQDCEHANFLTTNIAVFGL
jgi:hypothetical protein